MLLTKLDLRPYLGSKYMKQILRSGPSRISLPPETLNLSHFFTVPTENFWNSVALMKRDARFPSAAMGFDRVHIHKLWNNWPPSESGGSAERVRTAEFNPKHDLVAIVFETTTGKSLLSCHSYGGNYQSYCQILRTGDALDISWSREGSYLLLKRQSSLKSTLNFFRVSKEEPSLVFLRSMQMGTGPHNITARLWLTDNRFLFPGIGENSETPTRPWIYEIQEEGATLLVCQPEKHLRTELRSKSPLPYRGVLTALDNGFSCQVSFCKPPEARVLISHSKCHHSVVHFLDDHQNASKDLALPGIFVSIASKNEKAYIIYREASKVTFFNKTPVVLDPLQKHNNLTRKKNSPSKRRCYQLNTASHRLFFNDLPHLKCVPAATKQSNSSNFASSNSYNDDDDDDDNDNDDTESQNISSKKRKKKESETTKCIFCSNWYTSSKRHLELMLVVFNTETNQMEIEALPLRNYFLPSPPSDLSVLPHSSRQSLEEIADKAGIMSVSENQIFVRFYEMDRASGACANLQLHLGDPRNGWNEFSLRSEHRYVFMHPTKNVFLKLQRSDECSFPLTLHSCPDLLTDFQAFLEQPPNLIGRQGTQLKQLLFIVTDDDGETTSAKHVRARIE